MPGSVLQLCFSESEGQSMNGDGKSEIRTAESPAKT